MPRERGRGSNDAQTCFTHLIEVDGGGQTCVGDVAVGSWRVALTRVHDGGLRRGIEEPRSCEDAWVDMEVYDCGDGTINGPSILH